MIISAADYVKGLEQKKADVERMLARASIGMVAARSFLNPQESARFDEAHDLIHEARRALGAK
jgi:hypothetical protein